MVLLAVDVWQGKQELQVATNTDANLVASGPIARKYSLYLKTVIEKRQSSARDTLLAESV